MEEKEIEQKENFSKKSKFIKVKVENDISGQVNTELPVYKGDSFNQRLNDLLTIENDFYPCFDWEFPPPVLHMDNRYYTEAKDLFDRPSVNKDTYAIYMHIPFCISLCSFCYYSVIPKAKAEKVDEYVQYLKKEIDLYKKEFKGKKCESIYFGGGTPTYLTEDNLADLVNYVKESFDIAEDAEISMEASPGTLTRSKILKMKELGINRVSYGIQTLDSEFLATMNRDYDINESLKDIENLIEIIGNVNIDTMYGFKGEQEDTLINTITKFIEMGVPMLSIYGLDNQRSTYTPSANGPAEDKDRKEKMETFARAKEYLYSHGFKDILQNIFIKEGSVGSYKHQVRRWDNVTLLSMGIGSQGYAPEKIYQNISDMKQYYEALDNGVLPIVYTTLLSEEMEMARELTSKLRFTRVNIEEINEKYSVNLQSIFDNLITGLLKLNFIKIEDGVMSITADGSYYNNIIPLLFTPDSFKQQILCFPPEMIRSYPVSYVLTNLGKTECSPINISKA